MIVAQLVELDIFLEALERGVAGELLEAGDVNPGGNAARDRPASEAVAGKTGAVEPGEPGPVLDDQGDRIGVDRRAAEPVALGWRLRPDGFGDAPRWKSPQAAECGPSLIAAAASQASRCLWR
jgi:hypothetical protein